MLRLISPITLVFLMLALAVPAAGLAQGAGDQQYSDPFSEGEGGGGGNSGSGGGGNSGSGDSGSGNSGSGQPAPADSGQSQGSTATQAPQTQTTAPQAARGEQLPRTGYPAWLAALAGGVLLASGATLRVSLGLRR